MTKEMKVMGGVLLVWTFVLCAGFAFVLKVVHDGNKAKFDEVGGALSSLSDQVAASPKVVTLDLAKVARQWKGRNDQLAMKAVETTVKFYNEKGYLVVDRASVIGDVGDYEGFVPTPEKMEKMMSQARK